MTICVKLPNYYSFCPLKYVFVTIYLRQKTIKQKVMKKTILIISALFGLGIAAEAMKTDTQNTDNDNDIQKDSTMTKMNVLESIADGMKNGYLFIENGVVKGYKTIEEGVVDGFTAVTDSVTLKLFGKDGETVEQTKERLKTNAEAHKPLDME